MDIEDIAAYNKSEGLALSPEECWTMSMSKMCENNKMNCIGDECTFEQEAQDKFKWWSDVSINTFSCFNFKRKIAAKSENDLLFGTSCTAKDKFWR